MCEPVDYSLRFLLDDADFLICQTVELVDELVDQFISCVDLALRPNDYSTIDQLLWELFK